MHLKLWNIALNCINISNLSELKSWCETYNNIVAKLQILYSCIIIMHAISDIPSVFIAETAYNIYAFNI